MPQLEPGQWLFAGALIAGYVFFVYVLARESWFGLRLGRTGIYWRGSVLKTRKVIYDRTETPWKFRLALAANLLFLIAALMLPILMLLG